MAEDLWRADLDPHIAQCEGLLTNVGAGFLYAVHQDVHLRLGLPEVAAGAVQAAYRTDHLPTFSKAVGSRAQAFFDAATRRDGARRLRDLVHAVTESWATRGLLESRVARTLMTTFLIGRAQGDHLVHDVNPDPVVQAWNIVDPDSARTVTAASERACEYIQSLKDQTRQMVADQVLTAVLEGTPPQALAAELTHRFGALNRDWRRVAVTEVAQARAHGWLSGVPDGEQVEWVAAPDACPHCRQYHGKTFVVGKGPFATHVWEGKSNRGRSAARRTRDGRERSEEELYGPTIPLHPVCRCRFVRVLARSSVVSPRMQAYLDALVERAKE